MRSGGEASLASKIKLSRERMLRCRSA